MSIEPGGPIPPAAAWLGLILHERDLASAWPRTDPVVRLAIALGWLLNRGEESDDQAASLAEPRSGSALWPQFAEATLDAFADKWSFFDYRGQWGVWTESQPYAEGLELVFFMMTEGAPPGPLEIMDETPWATLPLLMRLTEEGWLVAGVSQAGPPAPGWPPTWPTGPKIESDL